jgi:hypothetical protein
MSITADRSRIDAEAPPEGDAGQLPAPDETIFRMRQAIRAGEHWFEALLDAVARWRLPSEQLDGRTYTYLVGGEAFDWLLLAERLLDEVQDVAGRSRWTTTSSPGASAWRSTAPI